MNRTSLMFCGHTPTKSRAALSIYMYQLVCELSHFESDFLSSVVVDKSDP